MRALPQRSYLLAGLAAPDMTPARRRAPALLLVTCCILQAAVVAGSGLPAWTSSGSSEIFKRHPSPVYRKLRR